MHVNIYGALIGLGMVCGYVLIWWWLKQHARMRLSELDEVAVITIIAGLFGARLWHVMTDFHLYTDNLSQIPAFWQGGMSILGALWGGGLAIVGWSRWRHPASWRQEVRWWLDVAVFGLPVAQAIGRLGNWFNQELYGMATNLPWALTLHRSETVTLVHPLFAYEAVPLLFWAVLVWSRKQRWHIGSGHLFALYIAFYSWLRVGLEFIRADKAFLWSTGLGINQVIVAVVGSVALVWLYRQGVFSAVGRWWVTGSVLLWLVGCVILAKTPPAQSHCYLVNETMSSRWYCNDVQDYRLAAADHQIVRIQIDDQVLDVELVNSPASITQGLSGRSSIGADGMLFVMPDPLGMPSFWMYQMKFDLDLVWINNDVIVDITTDAKAPLPNQATEELPVYRPARPANLVLEVPAGTAAARSWRTGSSFQWYH